jgi:GrpB-like predicted nucleotidyltransferase (UPF0157 family)/ribosomal protein S18 acetylase RimI-like enzyme
MHLETKHLIIRELTSDDLDAFSSLLGNPEVMHFSLSGPLSREQAKDYLEKRILGHYTQYGFGLWALTLAKNKQLIGIAGLLRQSIDGEELVELGYRLDPKYWGKGIASESAGAIARYAFDELQLDQIISLIDPKNVRSSRVALRLGMHYWKTTLFHNVPVQVYVLKRVIVDPFNTKWADAFHEEEKELKRVFNKIDIDFFHIGSTSIPGCFAKPIIDILGVTSDVLEIDQSNEEMIALGFRPLGEYGMLQRRFFHRKTGVPVNLHIFEDTDPEVGRHLRFCHFLKSHPDKTKEYSELKVRLAEQFPHDIQKYILGKAKFIKEIDILAALETMPDRLINIERAKRKQWTLEEILRASFVNMHLHMTYFAKYIPSMEIVFEPDVTVVRSQIADDTFNYVLSAHFTEKNVEDRICHVTNLFTQFHLPFSWWIGAGDSPPLLEGWLIRQGFSFKEKNIAMYLELAEWEVTPAESPLIFRRIESQELLKHFAEIITAIGGSALAFDLIYSQLPPLIYCGNAPLQMYVAYLENVPVVTAVLVTHANVAGIYYVATHPQKQKLGFGTAMMLHLLELAKRKGYFIATLQASHAGLPLYERLGFKRCGQFLEYAKS